jgi:hypothetical protein
MSSIGGMPAPGADEGDVAAMEARLVAALADEEVASSEWKEARIAESAAYERWRDAVGHSELAYDLFMATIYGAIGGADL